MDHPLKAVPDNLFTIYTGNTTRSCVVILYKSHTAPTASVHHDSTMQAFLRRDYLNIWTYAFFPKQRTTLVYYNRDW